MSLQEIKIGNSLLSCLDLRKDHRIVVVREHHLADGNFILTHLMKQILSEEGNKVCFMTLHNSILHYQNVCKRLGIDLKKGIAEGKVIHMDLAERCISYANANSKDIAERIFLEIKENVEKLREGNGDTYLIADDVSHFVDLRIELKDILVFANSCVNLTTNSNVYLIVGVHSSVGHDEIVANSLCYSADLIVKVSPLKTGYSKDVTGVIHVESDNKRNTFHYKAYDRGIRVFAPGGSLNFLYK